MPTENSILPLTSETTPDTVMIQNKSIPLTNLDDLADFINQTYLNDGK